jgi:hypothetical protein
MTELEAVQKAKDFLLQMTGVDSDPESTRLIERSGRPAYWLVVFSSKLFFAKELNQGSTVDGGEYVVSVNDVDGEVQVIG